MKAVQYIKQGVPPTVVEVPDPVPGPGQVLLKMTAAGLCHSDIAIMDSLIDDSFQLDLPLTLGHECVGVVVDAGQGARPLVTMGEAVMVYGPWGCGRCRMCADGYENYCYNAAKLGIKPPGLGSPGGAAEYMLVDRARYLIPIGDLNPVEAAPLTDAALTPYHAVKMAQPKLTANSTAVVLGVGGLGHVAVQLLKHLTPSTVVAVDIADHALELARRVGADFTIKSGPDAVASVMEITKGAGAEAVFDFAGFQATVDLGAKMTHVRGDWVIVGIGGGVAKVGFGVVPYECNVTSPYWGTRGDLMEVVSLAQRGLISLHTETFPLEDAPEAYQRLRDGKIVGRAVLMP